MRAINVLFPGHPHPPVCAIDDQTANFPTGGHVFKVKIYLPTSALHNRSEDNTLDNLCRALQLVQADYFSRISNQSISSYPVLPQIAKVKQHIQSNILTGVSIFFMKAAAYLTKSAKDIGAQIYRDVITLQNSQVTGKLPTTHIVCFLQNPPKHIIDIGKQNNVHFVSLKWLKTCIERWERIPEDNYIMDV